MPAYVSTTDDYRVAAAEVVTFDNDTGFQIRPVSFTGSSPSLSIAGTVVQTANTRQVRGIEATASSHNDGVVTIEAGGSMKIFANFAGGETWGYNTNSFSQQFINRGVFEVNGKGTVIGVSNWAGNSLVENAGQLTVTAASWARGVMINNPGTAFVNSGQMLVIGGSGDDSFGLEQQAYTGSFLNTGSIRVIDNSPLHDAVAVQWAPIFQAGQSWVNRGVLDSDYALKVYQYDTPALQTFTNEGTMNGRVDLGPRNGQLVNTGTITGLVELGAGDDVYAGRAGHVRAAVKGGDGADVLAGGGDAETLAGDAGADTLTGGAGDDSLAGGADGDRLDGEEGRDTVSGGVGNDTVAGWTDQDYLRGDDGDDSLSGGGSFDDLNGNQGDDTASGGEGDDWVVGGKDQDWLAGDVGDDIVYGNLGEDTCDGGAGADLVRGGQGNDLVRGGDGADWLSGDRGDDTVAGGSGADVFHGSQDAGIDRITDFSLAEGDRVQLDPGTTYVVSQVGSDTVIDMGGANRMVLAGVQMSSLASGWIFGA